MDDDRQIAELTRRVTALEKELGVLARLARWGTDALSILLIVMFVVLLGNWLSW
jgi:hypothetical protein